MYVFPKDFKGEARVYYAVSTAPPLPLENGYRVIRFPQNGIIYTSTPSQSGRAKDIFYIWTIKGLKEINVTDLGASGYAQDISGAGVKEEYELITVQ